MPFNYTRENHFKTFETQSNKKNFGEREIIRSREGRSRADLKICSVAETKLVDIENTGCFFHWYPPKKLKYGKPRLGESTLT